jgi:ribonuclease D
MIPQLIDNSAALEHALGELDRAHWLAVDTEFLRERTYYPKLCLLQIATPHTDFVIDTLSLSDLGRLGEFLADAERVKIFHAARQDLEALNRARIGPIGGLFDTQTAAALAGHPDQVSYAWLVEHYCDVTLDKSQTRTDWTQRPLSPAQLSYAQDDVKYLGVLYQALRATLESAGKLAWLWEETSSLGPAMVSGEASAEAWRRVRGLSTLPPAAWARGRALAAWREHTAQHLDIPRGWLLKDETLLVIAGMEIVTLQSLGALGGLAPATVRRHGQDIARVHADAVPSEDGTMNWRLTPEGTRLLGELQAQVKEVAAQARVSPGLLASRKDLEGMILGDPPARLLQGWRAGLLGAELAARVGQLAPEERRQSALAYPRFRARRP